MVKCFHILVLKQYFLNVAIDEMVVKWKGRWKNKQYNPTSKPYHIKTFGVCDSATLLTQIIRTLWLEWDNLKIFFEYVL